MTLSMTVVNAFTAGPFSGNPAAVVITREPLADALMQRIAAQNNLSETAFVVAGETPPTLRWFTPQVEVPLCGHATLAAAAVMFEQDSVLSRIEFTTASGLVGVSRLQDSLQLDFPARRPRQASELQPSDLHGLASALGCSVTQIRAVATGNLLVVELDSESSVRGLTPDFSAIARAHDTALAATALGDEVDFVARVFVPNAGINEDPVTGSAYTVLAPYWSDRLSQAHFRARQLSARGGELECTLVDERVLIAGRYQIFLKGEIDIDGLPMAGC